MVKIKGRRRQRSSQASEGVMGAVQPGFGIILPYVCPGSLGFQFSAVETIYIYGKIFLSRQTVEVEELATLWGKLKN
jgi:hypothetical protein